MVPSEIFGTSSGVSVAPSIPVVLSTMLTTYIIEGYEYVMADRSSVEGCAGLP